MSSYEIEKQAIYYANIGLFHGGGYRKTVNTQRMINNVMDFLDFFKTYLRLNNEDINQESIAIIIIIFEKMIGVLEKLKTSKEKSFNALTLA